MLASMHKAPTTQPELIGRARNGDMSAFEQLYRSHVDRIRALCVRLTADTALGDELCQRTFVRAWQQLHTFRGDSAWGTWLHRIAVTQMLMEQRSASRRGRVLDLAPPTAKTTPEGALLDLERAMTRLPDRARAVFVLHDVEGYRHSEVADLLGVTVGTSKAQLHRARRLLREELNR